MTDPLPKIAAASRWQFRWLIAVIILAAAAGAAWLLVACAGLWALAGCIVIAAAGFVLYRFGRADGLGVGLWCLAAAAMNVGFAAAMQAETFGLLAISGLATIPLFAASAVVFLLAAVKRRSGRAANCAGCVLVACTLIVPLTAVWTVRGCLSGQEAAQRTTENLIALHQLGTEVESFRTRLGRLPKDEAELVALRGKLMPFYRTSYSSSHPIRYTRRDQGEFCLECDFSDFWGSAADFWIFSYYGPNSTQRLHAESF